MKNNAFIGEETLNGGRGHEHACYLVCEEEIDWPLPHAQPVEIERFLSAILSSLGKPTETAFCWPGASNATW